MKDLIELAKQQAVEIAADGHNGWGNTMTELAAALEAARKDACVMKDALEMMAEQHRCGCGHPHCHNCERDRVCSAALAPKEVRNSI